MKLPEWPHPCREVLSEKRMFGWQDQEVKEVDFRECDVCQRPFKPRHKKQYCCDVTCQNLKLSGFTHKDL